jgi:ribosomal protein S27AE
MIANPYDEDIFLAYANTPLRGNPRGLYNTLGEMKKHFFWKQWEREFDLYIEKIIEMDKTPYSIELKRDLAQELSDLSKRLPNNRPSSKKDLSTLFRFWALFEVHGRKITNCNIDGDDDLDAPFFCDWGAFRGRRPYTEKCYVCDQKHFSFILGRLTTGNAPHTSDIGLLNEYFDYTAQLHYFSKGGELLPDLRPIESLLINPLVGEWRSSFVRKGWRWPLPAIFRGAVAGGLLKFLRDNDSRKLKQCPYCGEFFVAKHIKREFCYPPKKCAKIHKGKYQLKYMRKKRDPKSGKFDPKYI